MQQPRTPYQELTDPINENVLGTLTPKAWAKMNVVRNRAEWLRKVRTDAPRERPQVSLLHEAMRSSGSIGGEHRKDLVEGIQGARVAKMALSAMGMGGDGEEATNGAAGRRVPAL